LFIHFTTHYLHNLSPHVFRATHITHSATLSIDQSNCLPGFLNFLIRLSLDSKDVFPRGCWNVSHKQKSFSGLQSPRWSFSIKVCYSKVQTSSIFKMRYNYQLLWNMTLNPAHFWALMFHKPLLLSTWLLSIVTYPNLVTVSRIIILNCKSDLSFADFPSMARKNN